MHCNLEEVIPSQRAVLQRLGRRGGRLADRALNRTCVAQLVRICRAIPAFRFSWLRYEEVLSGPRATAERLTRFLGEPFEAGAAAAEVETGLRRQRAEA